MPVDPITAVFNFLATPPGQVMVVGLESLITDLVKLVHARETAKGVPLVKQ